jgi:hypothetical protein
MESKASSPKSKSFVFGLSSLAGVARGLVGFPIEQPLEAIKTQWQAEPKHKNELSIVNKVYSQKGVLRGFYAGSLPNLGRVLVKNVYRYPLMIGLPQFYQKVLPEKIRQDRKTQKLMTGLSIATIESFILCPFERLKTHFMTVSAENASQATFRTYFSSEVNFARDLFRGFGSLMTRQTVAWVSFLQADLYTRSKIRKIYNIPNNETIPSKLLIPAGCGVAVFSTLVIMPFDVLKTNK